MNQTKRPLTDQLDSVFDGAQGWLFLQKHALYGLSATRILIGIAVLGLLLSDFSSRHLLWGAGSTWASPFRQDSDFGLLINLFNDSNPTIFTLQYLILVAINVAVIIGWRTRLSTALLAIGLTALVERTSILGDQGDNITRIGLTLMVFMTTNAHWSLDARRRRKLEQREITTTWQHIWSSTPWLPHWLTSLIHNAALIALSGQLFILYTASALYKVQGDLWQGGTALYYPLALPEYAVFPSVNQLVYESPTFLTLATYFSVFAQLFFAVGLLHPFTRRLALVGVILLHIGIAVMMGLPWFSLAMLAFDAVFVTQQTWRGLEQNLVAVYGALRKRRPERL